MKLTYKNIILNQIEEVDLALIHQLVSDYSRITANFTTKIRSAVYWKKKWHENGIWNAKNSF